MSSRHQTRTSTIAVVPVVLLIAAIIGAVAASTSSAATSVVTGFGAAPVGLTVQDGVVPDGVTVFDDEYPAVANLDAGLLSALRRAARDAADDGVDFVVNSGWRSPAYQDELLHEAVARYGSEAEAAQWVATADTSLHVSGEAVDIGRADGAQWLSEHGHAYGLCRTYANEPWHFELRPAAATHGCPRPYADPTHDPRMQARRTVGR